MGRVARRARGVCNTLLRTNEQRPTTNDQRPTTNDQRPTTNDQRPTMLRSDFSYDLPRDLIAQQPRERGRSRMMVVTPPDRIEHDNCASFPSRLEGGDVLVINDTRVIQARLFAGPKGQMKN